MTVADYLISFAIVVVVLVAAWRGGQRNPVGTGRLARRMDTLELKVAEQGVRLGAVEASMLTLAETVHEINGTLQAMQIEAAADRGTIEKTWASVSRMEGFFVEQGIRGGRP